MSSEGKAFLRAVFLDRDGTINVEKDYLHRIEDFEFISGVPEAIRRLKKAGFLVIVVTNQSGVARGYFGLNEVEALHSYMQKELAQYETSVDGFYICPHHPTEGLGELKQDCTCRKGRPGMLQQASQEHNIDLSQSFMVGDKRVDLDAGRSAGCESLLVLTGYGRSEVDKVDTDSVQVFADLPEAVEFILRELHQ